MSDIKITKAGQNIAWFKGKNASDTRTLSVKVMEYADQHDLVIDQIDCNFSATPIYAYVLFSKRDKGTCAECQGECPPSDYLCSQCRS